MSAPTPSEVYAELEGFGITSTILSSTWLENKRDKDIIPWVKRVTRSTFAGVSSAEEYHSGTGNSTLILNKRPVISVTDLCLVTYGEIDAHLGTGNIEVIHDHGILKSVGVFENYPYVSVFPRGTNNLKVTYTYGYADYPVDVKTAILYLMCERALGNIANRTGGGDLNVQNYSRSFGERGKYSHVRNEYARSAHSLLKSYMTHIVGS